jgi:hypothetical protein
METQIGTGEAMPHLYYSNGALVQQTPYIEYLELLVLLTHYRTHISLIHAAS